MDPLSTHRRVARRKLSPRMVPRPCVPAAGGPQKREILSAGQLLKFLINFRYNFSIKSLNLQFIKEIKHTIIAHMVEEEKRAK